MNEQETLLPARGNKLCYLVSFNFASNLETFSNKSLFCVIISIIGNK